MKVITKRTVSTHYFCNLKDTHHFFHLGTLLYLEGQTERMNEVELWLILCSSGLPQIRIDITESTNFEYKVCTKKMCALNIIFPILWARHAVLNMVRIVFSRQKLISDLTSFFSSCFVLFVRKALNLGLYL